jgi:peptide chain release factor
MPVVEPMANLYQEWTLDQDQLLWNEYQKSSYKSKDNISELASIMGRGLQGVKARLTKLKDVNSAAYQRLFQQQQQQQENDVPVSRQSTSFEDNLNNNKKKLVPISDVLRRIQWDYRLSASDFSILHFDRVENTIVESPLDAPNQSIAGRGMQLIDALPEHRIVGVKYKERIVWDRDERLDLVFTNTKNNNHGGEENDGNNDNNEENGTGGIYKVIETYDTWIQERDALVEWNRKRQAEMGRQMEELLGTERFATLKQLSSNLVRDPQVVRQQQRQQQALRNKVTIGAPSSAEAIEDAVALKRKVEQYVQSALSLFRQVRKDPSQCLVEDKSRIPSTDFLALDKLSELVALLPDTQLRPIILSEISSLMDQSSDDPQRGTNKKSKVHGQQQLQQKRDLVVSSLLQEEDLMETFVRGTGPGGQKINKTSNRVVLVHVPTQIKVECQDTRSLQQNRNLARKRLLLKLDEYWNGSQSKTSIKAQEASSKKSKSLARSKARLERKRQAKMEQGNNQVDGEYAVEDEDDDEEEGSIKLETK